MANSEIKLYLKRTPFAKSVISQDPRLESILYITNQLKNHDLSGHSPIQVACVANEARQAVLGLLVLRNRLSPTEGVQDPVVLPRPISIDAVSTLLDHAKNSSPNLYVMRHGAQQMYAGDKELDATNLKIEMMKDPRNSEDPVTDDSLAEAVGQATAFKYLRDRRGRVIDVVSSRTTRAAQVGVVFAEVLGVPLQADPRLDCLSYPDEPNDVINAKLGAENKGSLPWDEKVIDQVIGRGTHARICRDMERIFATSLLSPRDSLIITHTQQTNRIDERLGKTPARYPNLGYTVASVGSRFYKDGVFEEAKAA